MQRDTGFARLLAGCHPGWRAVLEQRAVKEALAKALRALTEDIRAGHDPVPSVPHVFEALRYVSPDDAAVVVVGQDPYHTVRQDAAGRMEQAQGLCFSCSPHFDIEQPSLRNIAEAAACDFGFDPRDRPKELTANSAAEAARLCAARGMKASLHDLRFWAAQGVLLLNRALTTRAGEAGAHSELWAPFTDALIEALCAHRAKAGAPTVFLLWGGAAREVAARCTAAGASVLCWSHPSPLADNDKPDAAKFRACGHFRAANDILSAAELRRVSWLETPTIAACDGGCRGNGGNGACAGFGVMFHGGPLNGLEMYGAVAAADYEWIDSDYPLHGFRAVRHDTFPQAAGSTPPTNNRGEYLAGCYLLLAACRAGLTMPVEIVSDSNLFIKTMTEWLPARRAKGTAAQLKNFDLVQIAERLLEILRGRARVTFTHQRSHLSQPPPPTAEAPPPVRRKQQRSRLLWCVNMRADELATRGTNEASEFRQDESARAFGTFTITPPFWLPH